MEEKEENRAWHPDFKKYTDFIVEHENYKGLYYDKKIDGSVKWVVAGKSEKGQERRAWWDEQCEKHGVEIEAGCYAKIAVIIHPTKFHTCQICGRELSVEYVYPSATTLKKIERLFNVIFEPFTINIFEIIEEIVQNTDDVEKIKKVLKIKEDSITEREDLTMYIIVVFLKGSVRGILSPGVMSNSPDRFDGFHSDGNCCRGTSDKGRHKSNLQRYGQDRRVYENWADGDWKKADRLMSEFRKYGISADHIGPISLGFCHRPKFHPLTMAENSAKNNRMSLSDVQILIKDEESENVVSWHSKFIWDKLKNKVKTDKDAVRLSDFMRKNIHNVLTIFAIIESEGFPLFLESFLNPHYSFFDYTFEGFDPETGLYESVITKELIGKNQENNVERYKRVAFDKLQEYKIVGNRKVNNWVDNDVDLSLEKVIKFLKEDDRTNALEELKVTLLLLAEIANKSW